MKYTRFLHDSIEKYGIIENGRIKEITGTYFSGYGYTGTTYGQDQVRLLAPCCPSKVVAVGQNYVAHIKELGLEIPGTPVLFIKLPHTVIGSGDSIILPEDSERVDYEAELALVIKKHCKNISADQVNDYILGAACLNDVTARDLQKLDGQWTRSKNFETFCPLGPWIADGLDYDSLGIKMYLNGEVRQDSNTSDLIFNVSHLISFISRVIPLYPGDVVTTGTPSGVGPLKEGDVAEVEIEGIGRLSNRIGR